MTIPCPRCSSPSTVPGRVEVSGSDPAPAGTFYPAGIRFFTLVQGVDLSHGGEFLACLRCGLTWNEVAPGELLALMEKNGTEQTKAEVARMKDGL